MIDGHTDRRTDGHADRQDRHIKSPCRRVKTVSILKATRNIHPKKAPYEINVSTNEYKTNMFCSVLIRATLPFY